jgi:translation initiation factor 5A
MSTIKELKKGSFITIDDVPCKVDSVSVTKSGKHGASKARVDAIGLFDGRRRSLVKPADTRVDIPMILRKKAQVLAIIDEKVQIMDLNDYSTFELDIPEEMKGKLNSGEEIAYFEVNGIRTLRQIKG